MLIVWLFTDLLIKFMHSILLKFVGQSNKIYSLVFSSLFSGVFLILLINIIDLNYFYNYTPIIYCTDSNEEDPIILLFYPSTLILLLLLICETLEI